jgi:hypothetical protein
MEEGMSKFDRRHMLKVMAATAAGGAAAAVTRVGGALPALADSSRPSSPLVPASTSATTGPRLATTAATHYKYLDGLSDFNFRFSSTTWGQGAAPAGSIFPISTAADFLWTNLDVPQGVVLTEITLSVIVNDANPASWFFWRSTPSTSANANLANGGITTQSATVQNISLPISPTPIDNSQNVYGLYYGFGTANSEATQRFDGARLGWLLNPGLTLFPNPRRVVDGFATPFTSGTTYGPLDATVKSAGGASGVPAGATAAFCAVQSYSSGVLTIFPDLTTDTLLASYTAPVDGTLNLTYMMVPLSAAAKFKIHSYITGHVFVDVWGYVV